MVDMEKFQQWMRDHFDDSENPTEVEIAIWIGARESMRKEAMEAADKQWVKDPRVSASDAIKQIRA